MPVSAKPANQYLAETSFRRGDAPDAADAKKMRGISGGSNTESPAVPQGGLPLWTLDATVNPKKAVCDPNEDHHDQPVLDSKGQWRPQSILGQLGQLRTSSGDRTQFYTCLTTSVIAAHVNTGRDATISFTKELEQHVDNPVDRKKVNDIQLALKQGTAKIGDLQNLAGIAYTSYGGNSGMSGPQAVQFLTNHTRTKDPDGRGLFRFETGNQTWDRARNLKGGESFLLDVTNPTTDRSAREGLSVRDLIGLKPEAKKEKEERHVVLVGKFHQTAGNQRAGEIFVFDPWKTTDGEGNYIIVDPGKGPDERSAYYFSGTIRGPSGKGAIGFGNIASATFTPKTADGRNPLLMVKR